MAVSIHYGTVKGNRLVVQYNVCSGHLPSSNLNSARCLMQGVAKEESVRKEREEILVTFIRDQHSSKQENWNALQ